MSKLYRIRDWSDLFENNRTREMKHMNWVPFPTKLDGDGYTELVDRENGAAIYGCWCACVLIAGRCVPRGTLVRTGGRPHDSASLARISRLDSALIEEMLALAETVGWIDVMDTAEGCGITAGNCLPPNPIPNHKDLIDPEELKSFFDGLDSEKQSRAEDLANRLCRATKTKRGDKHEHELIGYALLEATGKLPTGELDRIIDAMAETLSINKRWNYFEKSIQKAIEESNGHG